MNLIDIGIESLIEDGNPEYVERSRVGNALKDMVMPGLSLMAKDKNNRSYAALVQALFDSGFLNTTESCFNLDMLWSYIYGYKMGLSVESFLKLFDGLTRKGSVTKESSYNPSGDNYYWALQFKITPTDEDIKTRAFVEKVCGSNEPNPWPDDLFRKVIVIERQSPMYAVVLDYCIFTHSPKFLHFVRLKHDYFDKDQLAELIEEEFKFDRNNYSAYGDPKKICKLISSLDLSTMECKPVIEPKTIESVLFGLYSGLDSLNEGALK